MKATLSVKLAVTSVCSLILILGVLLLAVQHFERRIIADHIRDTGEATGHRTARQALLGMMTGDLSALTRLVSQLAAEDGAIRDVVITDRQGRVAAACDTQLVGHPWTPISNPTDLTVESPIRDAEGREWGKVHMLYSLDPMRQVVGKTRQVIIILGAVACALGVVLAVLMARYLTSPLRRLWRASRQIAGGDYKCDLPTEAETDIAQIADGVQSLVDTIRQNEAKLRQAERHAAIGAVAAHAAHELKNSLTPIKSFGSALSSPLTQDATPALSRYLQRASAAIPRAVQRVENLTMGLLNLAKAPEYEMETMDAADLALSVCEMMREEAASRFIELSVQAPEKAAWCRVDREQMEGVLLNLVGNAVDAIRAGGIITIRVVDDQGSISMSVHDDGPGIPADIMPRIFDPYFSTKKGSTNNAGLGLALVQKIVVEHGGQISVASEPRSTIFTVTLPQSPLAEENKR